MDTSNCYKAFDKQVAGHQSSLKDLPYMMVDDQGCLFKHLKTSRVGEVERNFYDTIFRDEKFISLHQFLPRYYGAVELERNGIKETYLKLENIIFNLDQPNIIDIKIGKVTYDPFANKDKTRREYEKYPAQKEIGFRISGLQINNNSTNQIEKFSGDLFRNCACYESPHIKTKNYLEHFLRLNGPVDDLASNEHDNLCRDRNHKNAMIISHLLDHLIEDLVRLKIYLNSETRIKFYSSSILIAFDTKAFDAVQRCTNQCRRQETVSERTLHGTSTEQTDPIVKHIEHVCNIKSSNFKGNNTELQFSLRDTIKAEKTPSSPVYLSTNDDGVKNRYDVNRFEFAEKLLQCGQYHIPYQLKMIDFGHTYMSFGQEANNGSFIPSGLDRNYLFGIESLLQFLQEISEVIQ